MIGLLYLVLIVLVLFFVEKVCLFFYRRVFVFVWSSVFRFFINFRMFSFKFSFLVIVFSVIMFFFIVFIIIERGIVKCFCLMFIFFSDFTFYGGED